MNRLRVLGCVGVLALACVHVGLAADKTQMTKQIKSILKRTPKGKSYDKEFREILALGPAAVPSLIDVFHDSRLDWNDRWIAAMALGRFKGVETRKALEKGLKDTFPTIRMAAAKALGYKKDILSAPALRLALSDQAMVVRSAVAVAIGQLKDRSAVDRLSDELMAKRNFNQGKSFWVREDIIDALGNIGDEAAIPVLKKTLREKEPQIQQKTCLALSKITTKASPSGEATGPKCVDHWLKRL